MKRLALLACCLLTACPPVKPPAPTSCRESDGPKDCKPPFELGGHQGGFLEGDGLERLHFELPVGMFPPAPGTKLSAVQTCGSSTDVHLAVIDCAPVDEIHGTGAFACHVDVMSNPAGSATLAPVLPPICVTRNGGQIADPDPTHHRGVTVVRGFWDATGAWQDAANTVTLSCDAKGNDPNVAQFEEADGAITKCMREWQLDPQKFGDAFLACIRMARADYCGDGHPHTYERTEVGVSSPVSPMTVADCKDGRCFEASWSKNGAVCIARARWTGKGMDFFACRDQFVQTGALQCRGQPEQAVVFSRSQQYLS